VEIRAPEGTRLHIGRRAFAAAPAGANARPGRCREPPDPPSATRPCGVASVDPVTGSALYARFNFL
jgi:hypothetical protein